MPRITSRVLLGICCLALAIVLKWAFDLALWDLLVKSFSLGTAFERADLMVAVLSYLLPLSASSLVYAAVHARYAVKDDVPQLRRHPWQSKRVIVSVMVIVVSAMAGMLYGRVFGLPSIHLPSANAPASAGQTTR